MGKAFEISQKAGTTAFVGSDYRKAIEHFTRGAEAARLAGDWVSRGRFLANQSAALMMLGENRSAILSLLAARGVAERTGDLLTQQGVEANLASLYVLAGDYEAAAEAARRGAKIPAGKQAPEQRIRTLMIFGRAMAKGRGVEAGAPFWRGAMLVAAGSHSLEADILELWGYELGEQPGAPAGEAEELLARAWYKRKLANDGRLPLTEGKLARLNRKKGDIPAARLWINRTLEAVESGRKVPIQEWVLRAEDAHIAREEGRLNAAMDRYRKALGLVEQWRKGLPALERVRLGAERMMMQELFDGYLRTAGRLYRKEPGAALAAEMFLLIQNTRAWSLETHGAGNLPDGPLYAEARRMEGRLLAGQPAAGAALKVLRASILEQEAAKATVEGAPRQSRLAEPGDGEAVLTYWLHPEGSWLWVWTKRELVMTPLAEQGRILAAANRFRKAIEENQADLGERGTELRALLLGGQEAACLRARRWDIVADEGLYQIPYGALPGRDGGYLAEKIELRLVPNALARRPERKAERRFLAVSDPIFNRADDRRKQEWPWQRAVHAEHVAGGLPRLPGTAREAAAATAAWSKAGYETAVHAGDESSEEAVLARLTGWRPGIIHIATHTMEAAGRPRLALSLRRDGSPGLLTAEDIAALPVRADLVVMSACHSAGAESVSGSGLLGLTRAWLTAGSSQVISTLWPVGDESTAFFSAFYERLAGAGDSPLPVAAALQQAQLACIRSGGASAEPRNWAGHVLLARR